MSQGQWPPYPGQGGPGPNPQQPNHQQYANYSGPGPQNFGPQNFGPPPRKPMGPGGKAAIALVSAVALGALGAVGYNAVTKPSASQPASSPSSRLTPFSPNPSVKITPPQITPPQITPPKLPDIPTAAPAPTTEPVIEGWQGVASPRHGANYDVPQGWHVSPGTSVGYESKGGPMIGKSTLSQYGRGRCGKDYQSPTDVGLMGPGTESWDPADSASRLATRWAKARNTGDDGALLGDPPAPEMTQVQLKQGATAEVATVTLTPGEPSPAECDSTSVRFTVAAVEFGEGKRAIMVIRNAQNIPDAVSVETERQIVSSLRPQ